MLYIIILPTNSNIRALKKVSIYEHLAFKRTLGTKPELWAALGFAWTLNVLCTTRSTAGEASPRPYFIKS
ncbi:hypothetical protein KCG47_14350 [Microvirga sp. SRT04]|nr:hypothetical protein [Microvirga sp. SRT04]